MHSEFTATDERWKIPDVPGGLPSRLLNYAKTKLIPELEGRYHRRDSRFDLSGIDFHHGNPCTGYPRDGDGGFLIWLSLDCRQEPPSYKTVFQLAHECLHALRPVQFGRSTVLEEGLATEFSMEAVNNRVVPGDRAYATACDYVGRLRKLLPDLNSLISDYRSKSPGRGISDIERVDLRQAMPHNRRADFDSCSELFHLTTSFEYWRRTLS